MGIASSGFRLTRCGISDPSAREEYLHKSWYTRFVLVFAVLCVFVVVAVLLESGLGTSQRITVIGSVAFLAAWHWFYGRWHIIRNDLQAIVYLSGNILAIVIAIRAWDSSAILLFAIYWFGFAYLHVWPAIGYALVLTLSTQWAFGAFDTGLGFNVETAIGLTVLIILLGFSGMMAKYIEAFHMEAARNKFLLGELKDAQKALIEREREAGADQERRRVAGEIHDTIAQHFASVITNLQAASERHLDSPQSAERHVANALVAARQGLQDSRAMLATMQPAVLLGRSLEETLRDVASAENAAGRARVKFTTDGTQAPINRMQEMILVRCLQESLRNTSKHANAMSVDVTLSFLEDEVLLDITDDGNGFAPGQVHAGRDGYQVGLATMQSRVESVGGTFALESSPGEGTSVTVSFPTGGNP